MLSTLFTNPIIFLIWAVSLVVALTIHEYAHAKVADTLGDPTPRANGRVTLDPRAHLDPLGTVLILIVGFGWGRPVEFDPYNLRNPKRDTALIALAGPASNILLAIILSIVSNFFVAGSLFAGVIPLMIMINISLAIFNLVPVFPLDGEKILKGLLPHDLAVEYENLMRQYGTLILIMLLLPLAGGTSPISALISPAISFVNNLLL
ncbi:site-2 protease family protein [Candidatus Woesebacteria bacterium]|nr:site-2 protease family protein [Candidatus Woesebacteria bacterium]